MSWSTPVTNNTPSFASMNHLSAREGGPCSQGSESGEYRRSLNQQQNDALGDFLWDQRSRGYSQSSNDTLVPSGFYPIESTTLDPPEVIRANSAATKIPEEPLPHWMSDYMDDFGATGTCLGDQAHESPGGNPRANIGWSHDCINGEQGQALSDACQQAIQLESQSSNAPEFESTGEKRSESIELDNSLAGLDQADFRSLPYFDYFDYFDYFEPDGRDRLGNPLIESLDYDRCLIPASEMIADSLQPAIDSECIAEGSGEHLLSLFGQSNSEQTQPPSLIIVYCNGRGGSSAVDGVIRPTHGRHGPLPRETASRVAKTRKEKTVCIPCRTRKVSVSYN